MPDEKGLREIEIKNLSLCFLKHIKQRFHTGEEAPLVQDRILLGHYTVLGY
jgi:hypothetical protein